MILDQHKFGHFWILQHLEPCTSGSTWLKHLLELFFLGPAVDQNFLKDGHPAL